MKTLTRFSTPQLQYLNRGKVRDSFRVNDKTRLIVSTDRISAFDKILKPAFPGKGDMLNTIANAWFQKTEQIIPNHLIKSVDNRASLVREVEPIKIEMIVRGYLTGSAWRRYAKGERNFSGVKVESGMIKNQKFDQPIVTPTTKDENDSPITPSEIVSSGLVSQDIYQKMVETSLKLFEFGTKYCDEHGLILVDTKYEFGLIDGELVLIDEIHTPDSSRFWDKAAYEKDPDSEQWMDKEYIRQWILRQGGNPRKIDVLPNELIEEASRRYQKVYEAITGRVFKLCNNTHDRLYQNLVNEDLIKDGYVAIIMASKGDMDHAMKIKNKFDGYGVMIDLRMVSAHKNGEDILDMADEYNYAIEPGAVIAIAGRSNGLGGALSANFTIPVISCPPFADYSDMLVNLNSSIVYPSKASASTVVDPGNAAQAALRALNIPRLKVQLNSEIEQTKQDLNSEDDRLKREFRYAGAIETTEIGVPV